MGGRHCTCPAGGLPTPLHGPSALLTPQRSSIVLSSPRSTPLRPSMSDSGAPQDASAAPQRRRLNLKPRDPDAAAKLEAERQAHLSKQVGREGRGGLMRAPARAVALAQACGARSRLADMLKPLRCAGVAPPGQPALDLRTRRRSGTRTTAWKRCDAPQRQQRCGQDAPRPTARLAAHRRLLAARRTPLAPPSPVRSSLPPSWARPRRRC